MILTTGVEIPFQKLFEFQWCQLKYFQRSLQIFGHLCLRHDVEFTLAVCLNQGNRDTTSTACQLVPH